MWWEHIVLVVAGGAGLLVPVLVGDLQRVMERRCAAKHAED